MTYNQTTTTQTRRKQVDKRRERARHRLAEVLVLGEMNSCLQVNLSPEGPSEQHLPSSEWWWTTCCLSGWWLRQFPFHLHSIFIISCGNWNVPRFLKPEKAQHLIIILIFTVRKPGQKETSYFAQVHETRKHWSQEQKPDLSESELILYLIQYKASASWKAENGFKKHCRISIHGAWWASNCFICISLNKRS